MKLDGRKVLRSGTVQEGYCGVGGEARMKQKVQIIKNICATLLADDEQQAKDIARRDYPY